MEPAEQQKYESQKVSAWHLFFITILVFGSAAAYPFLSVPPQAQTTTVLLAAVSYEDAQRMCETEPDFESCLADFGYQWSDNGLEECTPESCPQIDEPTSNPTPRTTQTNTRAAGTVTGADQSGSDNLLDSKEGIVRCGKDRNNDGVVRGSEACHVVDIFLLFDRALKFVYTMLILPLAAISIAIAGWFLLTSGGDPGKIKKARTIITDTLIGIALVLCAWLIVHTVVKYLTDDKNAFYVPLEQNK